MITLTTPVAIPNGTRVEVTDVQFDEDNNTATVKVRALTAPVTDRKGRALELFIVDGLGTPETASRKVARGPTPSGLDDALVVLTQVNVPLGFTHLRDAWYAASGKAARRRAAETTGLADGWIDASLAGSVG